MAGLRLFHRINGQRPDGVDTLLVEVTPAGGTAGVVSGSGHFGPHWDLMLQCLWDLMMQCLWDLMMQCLSKCVESPLKSGKRLKGRAVPRSLNHYFDIPVL
jgi:hypothetical protein